MTNASECAVKYEPCDVAPWLIAVLAASITLFLVLSPVFLRFAFPSAVHRSPVGPYGRVPAPVLQISPSEDLAALRLEEEKALASYGWMDRQRRTVRIPIERAQELIFQRGLPGWP